MLIGVERFRSWGIRVELGFGRRCLVWLDSGAPVLSAHESTVPVLIGVLYPRSPIASFVRKPETSLGFRVRKMVRGAGGGG